MKQRDVKKDAINMTVVKASWTGDPENLPKLTAAKDAVHTAWGNPGRGAPRKDN